LVSLPDFGCTDQIEGGGRGRRKESFRLLLRSFRYSRIGREKGGKKEKGKRKEKRGDTLVRVVQLGFLSSQTTTLRKEKEVGKGERRFLFSPFPPPPSLFHHS